MMWDARGLRRTRAFAAMMLQLTPHMPQPMLLPPTTPAAPSGGADSQRRDIGMGWPGTPGNPYIRHLEIHAACDRFLASRGIMTEPAFRKSAWLYGTPQPRRSK